MIPRRGTPSGLLVLLLAICAPVEPAGAQIPRRIGEAVKQRAKDRKQESEDSLVNRIADRADSLLEKGARPIDKLIARTMEGIDSIALKTYRSIKGSGNEMDRELRDALKAGRVDLDLGFLKGKNFLSADGEALLESLARVLRKSKDDYVIEGRHMRGEDKALARRRALVVVAKLSELEVDTDRLHVVPRAAAAPDRMLGVVPVR